MATTRALSHLHSLVELVERADRQIAALAITLISVIEQMDAVMEDADLSIAEVLIKEMTGEETEFRLSRAPVKGGSLTLYLDDQVVDPANYSADLVIGVITLFVPVSVGVEMRAEYTVLGLAAQTAQLLDVMELDAAHFAARKVGYQTAIAWIGDNFGV